MKTILSLLIFNLLFIPVVYAASSEGARVLCRLMHLQAQPDNNPPFYAGDDLTHCYIPSEEFSRAVRLTAVEGEILFYKDESSSASPVAVAKIPPSHNEALLLFVPEKEVKEGGPEYRIIVINCSSDSLSKDGSIIFNISPNKMRYLIGEQKGYAHAGKMTSVDRPVERNDFQMSRVAFQTQREGKWTTNYESMLRFPNKKHRLFLAYHDKRTDQPGLRILRFNPE